MEIQAQEENFQAFTSCGISTRNYKGKYYGIKTFEPFEVVEKGVEEL